MYATLAASAPNDDTLTGKLTIWVESVIDAIGYAGVALLVALENVCPPIPSEVVLPAAGLWAADRGGVVPLVGMILASTLGSVVGAWALYEGAARVGPDRLRDIVARRGRWVGLKQTDVDRAQEWFDRRGDIAVLLCRCVPLVRSLVSIPAGCAHMNRTRFTLYSAAGSLVWNSALIMVGYAAASHRHTVEDALGTVQYGVAVVLAVALGMFVWRRVIKPRIRGEVVDH